MPARNGDYQNLYTPLSQNMTDSDDNSSEEELHTTSTAAAAAARRKARLSDRRRSIMSHQMRPSSDDTISTPSTGGAAIAAHHQHILDSLHQHGDGDAAHFATTHRLMSRAQHQPHHNHHRNQRHSDARSMPHSHHNSHPADASMADDVAILASSPQQRRGSSKAPFGGDYPRPPMGPVRRCLFIGSIVLCILTVVVFVWVVPCSPDGTCPARSERPRTRNWLRQYEGLELKGAINVVRGVRGRSNNLVFMYRGELAWMHPQADNNQSSAGGGSQAVHRTRSGIISLVGSTGAVSWYDECVHEPTVIDCALIDADRNGVHDCLVLNVIGELGCLDPVSGTWLWRIAARSVSGAGLLSFPLVLPDWDGDGVGELLLVTQSENRTAATVAAAATTSQGVPTMSSAAPPSYNTLIIVSGATGRTIGSRYVVRDCWFVHKFQLDAAAVRVSFNCIKRNGTEFQIAETLDTLQRLITNRSRIAAAKPRWTAGQPGARPIVQHKFYGQRRDTRSQRNIYAIGGKQLIVENAGKCPDACNVTVQLVEQRGDGKEHVVRSFSGARMYGMVPALLSFNASTVAKAPVHGFVIKFWQWAENDTEVPVVRRERRQANDEKSGGYSAWTSGDDAFADAEFNRFAHVMAPQSPRWRYPQVTEPLPVRLRRSTNVPPLPSVNGSYATVSTTTSRSSSASSDTGPYRSTMRVIRERVVLIVFNSTDTRIENTSQSNIVQFCRRDDDQQGEKSTSDNGAATATSSAAVSCQPDLNYQENSVLIADLDEDGSQELVTYYTTYVNAAGEAEPTKMDWKLVNYVQLLRLEAELPKLYAVDGGGGVGGGGEEATGRV